MTKTISDPVAAEFAALFGCEGRVRCSEVLLDKCEERAGPEWGRRDVPHSAGGQSSQILAECDARQLAALSHSAQN